MRSYMRTLKKFENIQIANLEVQAAASYERRAKKVAKNLDKIVTDLGKFKEKADKTRKEWESVRHSTDYQVIFEEAIESIEKIANNIDGIAGSLWIDIEEGFFKELKKKDK